MSSFIRKTKKFNNSKLIAVLLLSFICYTLLLPNFSSLIPIDAKALNRENVDYILVNANILTLDETNPVVGAIAIKDGLIHALGSSQEILQDYMTKEGNIFNINESTIMPGIIDGHTHLLVSALTSDIKTLAEAQEFALSYGYTTLLEKGADGWERDIKPLMDAEQNDEMRLCINIFPIYNLAWLEEDKPVVVSKWFPEREPILDHDRMLRVPGIKIYTDGSKGGFLGLPALSIPYPQEVNEYGDLFFTQNELNSIVKDITDAGFRCAFHSMGDRAIETVLNTIEYALEGETNDNYRHQLEHNSFLREDLITKVSELNTIHSVRGYYPTHLQHAYTSVYNETYMEWNVNRYSLPGLGIHAYLETDFTIELYVEGDLTHSRNINPFLHLWGLVTRRSMDKNGTIHQPEPCLAEHEISVDQALRMMTIEGAYAVSQEDYLGTLEVGKFADLIILSDDPMKIDLDELKDLEVYLTMVGGKIEYKKEGITFPIVPDFPAIFGPDVGLILLSMILGISFVLGKTLLIKKRK